MECMGVASGCGCKEVYRFPLRFVHFFIVIRSLYIYILEKKIQEI